MKIFILFFAFSLIIEGCSSSKLILNQTGSSNEAIENAILDFLNTNKNNKKDSVFSVKFYDTLYRMVLEKVDSINSRWVNGEPYNNIVGVSILEASNRKFLLTKDAIIGSKGKLPSRIFKKNGKIFYWWDSNYALTEETLITFKQYQLLKDDMGGTIKYLENPINDRMKATHYFFCRTNLSNFKKNITWVAIGNYDPPNVICIK